MDWPDDLVANRCIGLYPLRIGAAKVPIPPANRIPPIGVFRDVRPSVVISTVALTGALTACTGGSSPTEPGSASTTQPSTAAAAALTSARAACLDLAKSGGAPPGAPAGPRFVRQAIRLGKTADNPTIRADFRQLAAAGGYPGHSQASADAMEQAARDCRGAGYWAVYH